MDISVSIVIPTKDRPEGVRKAVASVLAALPADGEVIIIDDNSTPPASEALSDMKDPRIKVHINPGPNGPSPARNLGLRMAQGPIVMFLDDDDLLVDNYCKRVLARLPTLPDTCGFGFSTALHLEPDGTTSVHKSISPEGVLGREVALKYRLAGLGMGFWIKRDLFLAVGGLDPNIAVNEDTEVSIRLAAYGAECYCDQTPGVILIHDNVRDEADKSSITKASSALGRARGFEYILTKHAKFLQDHNKFRFKLFSRVLKYRCRAGHGTEWIKFCANQRPKYEAFLFATLGSVWLMAAIAIKRASRS